MGTSVDGPATGGGGLGLTGDAALGALGILTIGGSDLLEEGWSQLRCSRYQPTLGTGVGLANLAAGIPSDFLAVLICGEEVGLTSSSGLFLMLLILVLGAGRGGGRLCP